MTLGDFAWMCPAFAVAALPLAAIFLGRLRASKRPLVRSYARTAAWVVLFLIFEETFVLGPVITLLSRSLGALALGVLVLSQPVALVVVGEVISARDTEGRPEPPVSR